MYKVYILQPINSLIEDIFELFEAIFRCWKNLPI